MTHRTCVLPAYRLLTVLKSDSIAVIEKCRVADEGSHRDQLAEREKNIKLLLLHLKRKFFGGRGGRAE